MALKLTAFQGIRPMVSARLLGDREAIRAHNLDLTAGTIRPLREAALVYDLQDPAKTIYKWRGDWLAWNADVDVVRSPLAEDQYDRIYFTGDGVPKVRGVLSGSAVTYPLGLPKPSTAPTILVTAKTSVTWTRRWWSFWEEPDGSKIDETELDEGVDVTVVSPGSEYTATIPSRPGSASALARFILYFDAYRSGGAVLMGRVYPAFSDYSGNSDLYIDGAKVSAKQNNKSGTATFTLDYDTSEASDYTVSRSWVYTYVSAFGEEGPPSDPTAVYDVSPAQTANLSDMGSETPDGYNVTKKRIYRTVTGDAGTAYQFIAEIPVTQDAYDDNVLDEDAAESLPSQTWTAPPEDLAGLVAMPGGFLAGFSGRTVYFSEAAYPHAWPAAYGVTIEDNIVALAVSGTTLVVLTDRSPYFIPAPDPVNTSVIRIPTVQACVAERSVVELGGSVFYAGTDGLAQIRDTAALVVTTQHYTKEQWQAEQPAAMFGEVEDSKVFMFTPTGGLMFMFSGDAIVITTHDYACTGAWYDPDADVLRVIRDATIRTWDAVGGAPMMAEWKSREYDLPRPQDFGVCRVTADAYPVYFNAATPENGRTVLLNSDVARRLPYLRPSKFWTFQVSGTYEIREIVVSHAMGDLEA